MSNIDVNVLRREFQNALSTLLLNNSTFILGMVIKATKVIATNSEPTLSTDGKTLRINPSFFLGASPQERVFLLAHEAMHIARMDPVRFKNYIEKKGISASNVQVLYNIVADAKINTELQSEIKVNVPKGGVTCDELAQFGISAEECVQKSTEELVDKILQNAQTTKVSLPIMDITIPQGSESQQSSKSQGQDRQSQGQQDQQNQGQSQATGQCSTGSQQGQQSQGQGVGGSQGAQDAQSQPTQSRQGSGRQGQEVVLNEGDKELLNAGEKELKNKIVQIIYTASIVKGIGNMPNWAKRIIDELTKEKVDWRRILAKYLHGALAVRRKLTRENRKNPDLIGKEVLGKARIVVLIDTSGSIGEEELRQFVSEVRAMVPYGEKIVVIPFDVVPHGEFIVRTREDVRHITLTGGGGTEIGSTLELVDKKYNRADAIVILSDWLIGDLDSKRVVVLLRKYARKIIAVTTSADPPKYLPNRLKIEVAELKR